MYVYIKLMILEIKKLCCWIFQYKVIIQNCKLYMIYYLVKDNNKNVR